MVYRNIIVEKQNVHIQVSIITITILGRRRDDRNAIY